MIASPDLRDVAIEKSDFLLIGPSGSGKTHRAQVQTRAVENTMYVVHANAPANDDMTGSHGQSRVIAPDGNIVQEASMFGEEIIIADLELRKATAENARRSLDRGPLTDWWREGLKRVRVIVGPKAGGLSQRGADR